MEELKELKLSVKKICSFLKKWGFKLQISRSPHSSQSTYKIVDVDVVSDKKEIFVGNYKHFLKFLASLTILYEKMLEQAVEDELKKEKIKGGVS